MNNKIFLLALIILLTPSYLWGACSWSDNTGTVASPYAAADVNACVSDASSKTGDVIINIPACSVTWTDTVTVNMSSGFANVTALTIMGSGTLPAQGSASETVVNLLYSVGFSVTSSPAKKWRISNIEMRGGSGSTAFYFYTAGSTSPITGGGFRIDHIDYVNPPTTANYLSGYNYGVIDSNIFTGANQFSKIHPDGRGNYLWHQNLEWGTAKAIYFENNTVTGTETTPTMFCDTEHGGRVVIRYNTITRKYTGGHDASSVERGIFSSEIYNNTMIYTSGTNAGASIHNRGGTYMVYNNTITSAETPYEPVITLTNYRSFDYGSAWPWTDACDNTVIKICAGGTLVTSYSPQMTPSPSGCSTDADCGGESGSCINIDGNTDGTGYPCRDQIGRTYKDGDQVLEPALFWANTYNGSDIAPGIHGGGDVEDHIKINRDYCYHASTMPSSCGGVETTYTAYEYPHPLRTDAVDETPPTVNSATIQPNGTDLVIVFDENITATDNAAFTVDPSGADVTVDCPAVESATYAMTCVISREIQYNETATYGYTGTTVEDTSANDLATISNTPSVVNNSTVGIPTGTANHGGCIFGGGLFH